MTKRSSIQRILTLAVCVLWGASEFIALQRVHLSNRVHRRTFHQA